MSVQLIFDFFLDKNVIIWIFRIGKKRKEETNKYFESAETCDSTVTARVNDYKSSYILLIWSCLTLFEIRALNASNQDNFS